MRWTLAAIALIVIKLCAGCTGSPSKPAVVAQPAIEPPGLDRPRDGVEPAAKFTEAVLPASKLLTDRDLVTQVSVINALMVGRYDGVMSMAELLRYGDFGVGTLDHLDGELIVLEGKVYRIRADGAVVEVSPATTTPFAVITPFEVDGQFPCPRLESLSALDTRLNQALPQKNNFLAIRVDARFASITMRSVRRQEPPYKPLAEVAKSQSEWTKQNVSGTLVGMRCPTWVTGLNVPGYHWHFLSDDHTFGGHVLDCQIIEGRVQFDLCTDWLIKLEATPEFSEANLGQDLSKDLHKVESSRGTKKE
jgi:acetolactate decarboxylase